MGLLLKVLNNDLSACHGGTGRWEPPGAWMPDIAGDLLPCRRGYHLCTLPQLLDGWWGPAVFLAEYDGDRVDTIDKSVVRRARLVRRLNWDERTARLFAADCAEHILANFEERYPDDGRLREAIAAARRMANGESTVEAESAAWSAAASAAWSAAGSAAGAAAWSAAASAARSAAWSAAESAAWSAAWSAAESAAWSAARSAERYWQIELLVATLGLTDEERDAVWPERVAAKAES